MQQDSSKNCYKTGLWRRAPAVAAVLMMIWISVYADDQDPDIVLFHQGDDALSWDHDALTELSNLHSRDISDKDAFLQSGSVGDFLNFRKVQALHMPVPVNIVFIGFESDGNMHVNITTEQLQEWFGHLDHILPHTRVELAELTCAEDGHCSGLVHGRMAPQPVPSYVHLNFSCNLVVTRRVNVMRTFERALHAFSRPVDPEIEMGAQQVDAARMERFIDHFLDSLGIMKQGYSLVVLNPPWSVSEPVYGYRLGMSQPELVVLESNKDKIQQLVSYSGLQEPVLPAPQKKPMWHLRQPRQNTVKFGATDMTGSSEAWVAAMDKYLAQVEDYRKKMLKSVGPLTGAAAVVHAAMLLRRKGSVAAKVLHEDLFGADPYSTIHSKFRTMHPAEDCMVGNWVSHQRWVMIDLTAGGFDWGPALGGEGVVHKHSMPSVVDHFTPLLELRKEQLAAKATEEDKQKEQMLQDRVNQQGAQRANIAYQAFAHEQAQRRRQREMRAPGEPPLPDTPADHDDAMDEHESATWRIKYQETLLKEVPQELQHVSWGQRVAAVVLIAVKAELDVYAQFASSHCVGQASASHLCDKIKTETMKAKNLLVKLSGAQASTVDVWRDLDWNILGEHHPLEASRAGLKHAHIAARARDMFLSQLSNVLSGALRHVIAPPTATWTYAAGYLHDTATPYANHVVFKIYTLKEDAHLYADHMHANPFDIIAYKTQVSHLALPGQRFSFEAHTVALHDDEVLATAVAAAQHSSMQEIPFDEVTSQSVERVYLDTRVLAHVLRQRFKPKNQRQPAWRTAAPRNRQERLAQLMEEYKAQADHPLEKYDTAEGSSTHANLEVPVFVFELRRDYAVLLDEHYSAKALEDMIVVVQNAAREDEHPTGMMCNGGLLARPLSPLREALSSTLTFLSGVLPPHLGYDPRRHKVTHDWLWSVGSHPHSFTSVGTEYTELQKDALARSYLLDAVDSSVDAVNEGIKSLRSIRPTLPVYQHLRKHKAEVQELLNTWGVLLQQWRDIMEASWRLSWGEATVHLQFIEDKALRFMHLSQVLTAVPLGSHCTGLVKPTTEHLVPPVLMLSAAIAGFALLWLLFPVFPWMFGRGASSNKNKVLRY